MKHNLKPHIWKIIIPQHIILIAGIVSIMLGYVSAWNLLLIPLGYLVFGYLGFTIFMHRYWCHRSFKTYPALAYFGAYIALLCGNGTPIEVEAIHMRLHHANSDKELDPHTPLKGKLWSWLLWHNMDIVWPKLNRQLLRDPILKFMHRHYFKIWWASLLLLTLLSLLYCKCLVHRDRQQASMTQVDKYLYNYLLQNISKIAMAMQRSMWY